MELLDAMRCAPTSRLFKADAVPREMLVRALDAARFAPSGGNRQGWRVVVVEDPARRAALRDLYLPHWRAYLELTGGARMLAEPDQFDAAHVGVGFRDEPWPRALARRPVEEFAFSER